MMTLSCLLFASCTKEIEFNGDQTDPKLVMNGIIEPNKPISLNVSKSYFFLDNEGNTLPPDDLQATLYVNGNRIGEMTSYYDTLLSYDYWGVNDASMGHVVKVYTHEYCPSVGDVVTIAASANGYDDAEATASPIPDEVTWSISDCQIDYVEKETYEYEGDTSVTVTGRWELVVEINDPNPGQTGYYRIHVDEGGYYDYENGITYYLSATYDDPVFGGSITDDSYLDIDFQSRPEGVFTDDLFDGKSYQIKIPLYLSGTFNSEPQPDLFQFSVRIERLSKEYYYYLNTCEQTDEVMQFFTEPIQTYSNVKGGYGIVGSCTSDSASFTLPLER